MLSRRTVFQPPLFSPKAPCEPAVSDDTLGPAHRQHPDIEEPGTPAFLLQGTQHRNQGLLTFYEEFIPTNLAKKGV